jgi:hypothetical protein
MLSRASFFSQDSIPYYEPSPLPGSPHQGIPQRALPTLGQPFCLFTSNWPHTLFSAYLPFPLPRHHHAHGSLRQHCTSLLRCWFATMLLDRPRKSSTGTPYPNLNLGGRGNSLCPRIHLISQSYGVPMKQDQKHVYMGLVPPSPRGFCIDSR